MEYSKLDYGTVRSLAEAGDVKAQYISFCHFMKNNNTSRSDMKQAMNWLRKAANQHHGEAAYELSQYYCRGVGQHHVAITTLHVLSDTELPTSSLKEARARAIELAGLVACGDTIAMIMLAECYENGDGVTQDYTRAFQLYEKAVALGNTAALLPLAECHLQGHGVQQDYFKAVQLLQQCIASTSSSGGGARDYFLLSQCYEKGLGVTHDDHKAVELLEQGLALNPCSTLCAIALGIHLGQGTGVDKDEDRAILLLEDVAKLSRRC